MAEVHCISIGYPVEMGVQNGVGDAGFIIEVSPNVRKYITAAESAVWTKKLVGGNYTASDNEISLYRKDILVIAQNIYQLLFQLSALRPIKQGVGTYSAKSETESIFRILIGNCAYNLSPIQHIIWSCSNGYATLSEIIERSRDKLMCAEEQLYKEIQGLLYNGLIFFIR